VPFALSAKFEVLISLVTKIHLRGLNGRGRACGRDGPAYWAAMWLGGRETKLIFGSWAHY